MSASGLGYIGLSFTGSQYGRDSSAVPADAAVGVGPTQVVEFVNGRFSVYRKSDGSLLQTMNDSNFWHFAGLKFPRNWDVTDPRIVYDSASQRWFASEIDYDPQGIINTNRFLLAVSATTDAASTWNAVAIPGSPSGKNFADFPTLGLDADGVYLAGDLFDPAGSPLGPTLVSLPKAGLLGVTPEISDRTSFGVLSYQERGYILQPVICLDGSEHGLVLAAGGLGFDYSTGDFATNTSLVSFAIQNAAGPSKAALTPSVAIPVPGYTAPINPPQPDGSSNLDDGDSRISSCVDCVAGVLYAVHGTQVDGRSAVRWYRISAATGALLESGTLQDANQDFFYPSIAANANGRMVIAFNGCGPTTFVSCYAVVGEVIDGTTRLGDPLLIKSGVASYQNTGPDGTSRWGDYSAACVDPSDPDRFWLAQQFASGGDSWSTQLTEVLAGELRLNIAAMNGGVVISWPHLATPARLQQTSSLGISGSWSSVTQTPATNAGTVSVSVPFEGEHKFFRLVQP